MLDQLISFIAPHYCSGCGDQGTLLCSNCKYDIIYEPFDACMNCNKQSGVSGVCASCRVPYSRAWCVADRRDQLQQLIDTYKFTNTYAAYRPLGGLLHERLPELPATVVIVPIPTVRSHIRQRGYDHMLLIARQLSRLRQLPVTPILQRATSTKQRDASRKQRISQAKVAFRCRQELDPSAIYLLLDDVVTTGATMKYAAQTLCDAGAKTIWAAAICRQPLD